MKDLFKSIKVRAILLLIGNRRKMNCLAISRKLGSTYSHSLKCIRNLEGQGLINVVSIGRENNLSLTKKGLEVAQIITKLKTICT